MWHNHFIPSILAGIAVAVITWLFEMTASNVILLASVGASAMILTHTKSHHLTSLHTTISAYIVAIIISVILNATMNIPQAVNVFASVFLVGIVLF